MELCELLQVTPGITAIIGSGGKTSLMLALAGELARRGRVIVTTSTRIYPPEGIPVVLDTEALGKANPACLASRAEHGKLSAPECGFAEIARMADFVLVEADGSRGLPLKAHASHEPVIPEGTGNVICVVGADGFGQSAVSACHRPERFCALTGADANALVTAELAAAAAVKEGFAHRFFINKTETPADWDNALRFAQAAGLPTAAGSLRKGEYRCLR